MSFSFTALQRVRAAGAGRAAGAADRQGAVLADAAPGDRARTGIVGPGIALLREHPRLAGRIADSGHDIHVWTVNTEADLRLCLELGVQAVITDRPAYMLELLGK